MIRPAFAANLMSITLISGLSLKVRIDRLVEQGKGTPPRTINWFSFPFAFGLIILVEIKKKQVKTINGAKIV